jgi:hypothetical protein
MAVYELTQAVADWFYNVFCQRESLHRRRHRQWIGGVEPAHPLKNANLRSPAKDE